MLALFFYLYLIPLSVNTALMILLLAKLFKIESGEYSKVSVILKSIPVLLSMSVMSYWGTLLFLIGVLMMYSNECLTLEMIREGTNK